MHYPISRGLCFNWVLIVPRFPTSSLSPLFVMSLLHFQVLANLPDILALGCRDLDSLGPPHNRFSVLDLTCAAPGDPSACPPPVDAEADEDVCGESMVR